MNHTHPILMLHGLGGNKNLWNPLISYLDPSYEIYSLDLPGHGASSFPLPSKIRNVCDIVCQFFEEKSIQMPFTLIGHSLGGLVALQFAVLYPHLLNRLVLFNTHYKIDLHPDFAQQILQGKIEKDTILKSLGKQISEPTKSFILKEVGSVKVSRDAKEVMDLSTVDLSPQLRAISCPTLIFAGAEDPVLSLRKLNNLSQKIALGRLIVFPNAGHYVHIEEAQNVAKELSTFLL